MLLGLPHPRYCRLECRVRRGIERDLAWGGTREDTETLYEERYLPADRLYFETVRPELKADVIIDNTDPDQRIFTVRSS
jgi:hypothetical protein